MLSSTLKLKALDVDVDMLKNYGIYLGIHHPARKSYTFQQLSYHVRVKGKSEDEKESKKEALMSIEGHNDLLNERMFYICLHMMYLIITR